MRRSAPDGGAMSAYAARFIKPNDRLTSFERLEIYNRQYWFRLRSSMVEDFPGLRAVVGSKRFEAMSTAYLTDCPSRSFTLRNLGAGLEGWSLKHSHWLRGDRLLALDMLRLEWAELEAFDGQAKPALRAEDLQGMAAPDLGLGVQPYVKLLELHYPVDDLLLAVKGGNDESTSFASNAVQDRRKDNEVHAVAKQKPARVFLAVHRLDFSVYFRRISQEEYVLLSSLRNGKSVQRAIELAFHKSAVSSTDRASSVQHSFQTWATLGWFCQQDEHLRAIKKKRN
jgi:Putative DNA-binding domain